MGYESRFFLKAESEDDGLPKGAIAGIAIAATIAVLAVCAIMFMYKRERQGSPLFTPLMVTNTAHSPDNI